MPLRDYTDFLPLVFGSKERVYFIQHIRNLKNMRPLKSFTVNGHSYLFNPDRAIRVNWAPWKKIFLKKPIWSITELARSKKIGLLLYQEPGNGKMIEEKVPVEWKCSGCAFKTVKGQNAIKAHVRMKHKEAPPTEPPEVKYKVLKKLVVIKEPIEPMDLSKVKQPSGVFTNEP